MIYNDDDKTKWERIKDLAPIKREIISYLFDFVSRHKTDQWFRYKGEFKYEGQSYDLECDCKYDNQVFTYRNLYISHKQVELNVDDVLNMNLSALARKH